MPSQQGCGHRIFGVMSVRSSLSKGLTIERGKPMARLANIQSPIVTSSPTLQHHNPIVDLEFIEVCSRTAQDGILFSLRIMGDGCIGFFPDLLVIACQKSNRPIAAEHQAVR